MPSSPQERVWDIVLEKFAHAYKHNNAKKHCKPHWRWVLNMYDDNGKIHNYVLLSRFIAKAFIPNPDEKPIVDHIDGNSLNDNIKNLRWATYSESAQNRGIHMTNHSTGFKH